MRALRGYAAVSWLTVCAVLAACTSKGDSNAEPVADAGIEDASETPETPDAAPTTGLLGLTLSSGQLSPAFNQATDRYIVEPAIASLGAPLTVTPTYREVSVTINGVPVPSGSASPPIPLDFFTPSSIDVAVTPDGGGPVRHFTLDAAPRHEAYAKASNTRADANFGYSVALSGDTLVVGAPSDSSNASGINGDQANTSLPGAGAVYVFTRSGLTWSQQAYLKASNPRGAAYFGSAVALSGDTLAVAANQEPSNASGVNGDQANTSLPRSGAVYIFTRSGTTWSQQAYIKASNPIGNGLFGYSLAVLGDTLAVGAIGDRSDATGINGSQANANVVSGAAYVFTRSGTAWSQEAYVKASNTGVGANFGQSVTLSGNTMVVGADGERSASSGINGNQNDTSAPNTGAAYVFTKGGGVWSQQAYLKASNARRDTAFGVSVAMSGETLAIGSYTEASNATGINGDQSDTSAPQSGATYVFTRAGTNWSQQAYIKASNTLITGLFGSAVALEGDTLVVAAYGDRSNATGLNGNQADTSLIQSGASYVFERTGTTWSQRSYLKAINNGIARAYYGWSLSLSRGRLAVGSWGESSNATGINGDASNQSMYGAGAVYLLR